MVHHIINEYIYNLTMRWIKDCYGYDCCNNSKSYIIIYYKKRLKKKENKNKVVHSIIYVALLKINKNKERKQNEKKKPFSEVT